MPSLNMPPGGRFAGKPVFLEAGFLNPDLDAAAEPEEAGKFSLEALSALVSWLSSAENAGAVYPVPDAEPKLSLEFAHPLSAEYARDALKSAPDSAFGIRVWKGARRGPAASVSAELEIEAALDPSDPAKLLALLAVAGRDTSFGKPVGRLGRCRLSVTEPGGKTPAGVLGSSDWTGDGSSAPCEPDRELLRPLLTARQRLRFWTDAWRSDAAAPLWAFFNAASCSAPTEAEMAEIRKEAESEGR